MGYLEAHYAHLIYHCRGSTAGGADVARAVVERVFRPVQKVSANPYFYHTSFPPLFSHPQSASLTTSRRVQKVSENPYFYHTSFPPLFSHHRITSMLTSWSVLRTARPPSPAVGPRLARSRRSCATLAGYHPYRRPLVTAYDRSQIGTKTARTNLEWIQGLCLPRHGAQGGVAPPAIEHCGTRFEGGLQNAEIAFQPPWYKFETPCPLVRPSQTHLWRSARAPVDRGPWGFGEGWYAATILVIASQHPLVQI